MLFKLINCPFRVLSFVSGVFPAFELVAWPVDGYVGPAQELLGLPLQAPLHQDAPEDLLHPLIEPLVVEHEVPPGVVGVKRVRYVGAGVPADAQLYPSVVQSINVRNKEVYLEKS